MRRIATIAAGLVGLALLLAVGTGARDPDRYLVRAIFDNAGFLVPGEDVRIAGARVGQVDSVGVTGFDDQAHEDGSPEPGKAYVVLEIADPGFQDFRSDASCLVRPQSLLGEKFVECRPTEPRAPGAAAPPPLHVIAEGKPGAGERFLPLEQNGKAVDLDLVNNIMREPYADRFRLILNDLGAGLAARGKDLEEIVRRGDPALRETDQVLAILAQQNRGLAQLARDSDVILAPLARERERVSGFVNNAAVTAQATAARSAELEAGIQKLPRLLRELRPTMAELDAFATQSTPVVADLRTAAPDLTRITRALGPFSRGGTTALTSLGRAASRSGDAIAASDPIIRRTGRLAQESRPVADELDALLAALQATGGYRYLTRLLFNTTGSINAFDRYGHFMRALLPFNNCVGYVTVPLPGCLSIFTGAAAKAAPATEATRPKAGDRVLESIRELLGGLGAADSAPDQPETGATTTTTTPTTPDAPTPTETTTTPSEEAPPPPDTGTSTDATPRLADAKLLLDFFMGESGGAAEGGR